MPPATAAAPRTSVNGRHVGNHNWDNSGQQTSFLLGISMYQSSPFFIGEYFLWCHQMAGFVWDFGCENSQIKQSQGKYCSTGGMRRSSSNGWDTECGTQVMLGLCWDCAFVWRLMPSSPICTEEKAS